MSKKLILLLLATFVLAACEPSKKLSPEEQRELDREDRKVWRQMSGGYGPTMPSLQVAQYALQRPIMQTAAVEFDSRIE